MSRLSGTRACFDCKKSLGSNAFEPGLNICNDCQERRELKKNKLGKLLIEEKLLEQTPLPNVPRAKILKRKSYFRGSLRQCTQHPGRWIVDITINEKRIHIKFTDFKIADKVLKLLQKVKEFEYAKEWLSYWNLQEFLTLEEIFGWEQFKTPEYKDLAPQQRNVIVNIYNTVNERIKDKKHRGRYLGPQIIGTASKYSPDSKESNWRHKLKQKGWLKEKLND